MPIAQNGSTMTKTASFQTRARAIDHLGRGQIADAPTAISELWKNAYDAFARNVELHIFDGKIKSAATFDNGHGMTVDNILDKWLVIGTDSKAGGSTPAPEDTFGLPQRVRQGEKGIGRLSAAFLGPITLLISKKANSPFSVLMVDWRFFENPYLFIDDISFPIREAERLQDIPNLLTEMYSAIQTCITEASPRVRESWNKYSTLEKSKNIDTTTQDAILTFSAENALTWSQLFPWWEMLKKIPSKEGMHGTALFSLSIYQELANWLEPTLETPEQQDIRKNLHDTLISFIDPLQEKSLHFEYSIFVHANNKPTLLILSPFNAYNIEQFKELEHCIIGEVDEYGKFTGWVKAFNKEIGIVKIEPQEYIPSKDSRTKLGPFSLRLATIEQEERKSSHSHEDYIRILVDGNTYAGICMFRDGLRILPYGREGADLFEVEKRRTQNAGLYFFSMRRTFGGVSFKSVENPNLKDKAGREGLVDNGARRALVRIVKHIMIELAKRYFGRASELREPALKLANKRHAAWKKEAEVLKKRTKKNFKAFLKVKTPKTITGIMEAKAVEERLTEATAKNDKQALFDIREAVSRLDALRDDLRLPIEPLKDEEFEDSYREYRDAYSELSVCIERLKQSLSALEAEGFFGSSKEVVISHFRRNQSKLSAQVGGLKAKILSLLKQIQNTWEEAAAKDTKKYHAALAEMIVDLDDTITLRSSLDTLDRQYLELRNEFELRYSPPINVLEQISENIDVEGAYLHTEQENERLQKKVEMLHSVAQLGITVEIIGHELEALESQVTSHMKRMPQEVKNLNSYKLALEAHRALVDRLRFLAPLKKSSYRSRVAITGKQISLYLRDFFGDTFTNSRTDFITTKSFEALQISDLPSRIYPTFINIVNNALYWVQFTSDGKERKICVDCKDDSVVISDTGPGVDPDDINDLFSLFFTKKVNGRGVGLYLCRQNLAASGHEIRYAEEGDLFIYNGANFIIKFKDATYVGN